MLHASCLSFKNIIIDFLGVKNVRATLGGQLRTDHRPLAITFTVPLFQIYHVIALFLTEFLIKTLINLLVKEQQ